MNIDELIRDCAYIGRIIKYNHHDDTTDSDIYLAASRIAEKYRKRAYDQWDKEAKAKVHINELKRIVHANSIK